MKNNSNFYCYVSHILGSHFPVRLTFYNVSYCVEIEIKDKDALDIIDFFINDNQQYLLFQIERSDVEFYRFGEIIEFYQHKRGVSKNLHFLFQEKDHAKIVEALVSHMVHKKHDGSSTIKAAELFLQKTAYSILQESSDWEMVVRQKTNDNLKSVFC